MKHFFSFFLLIAFTVVGNAQVGIGTLSPDESAMLDVVSTDKGFLPPRLGDPFDISNPATGLIVYDTTRDCLVSNTGTPAAPVWDCIGANNNAGGSGIDIASLRGTGVCTAYVAGLITFGSNHNMHNAGGNNSNAFLSKDGVVYSQYGNASGHGAGNTAASLQTDDTAPFANMRLYNKMQDNGATAIDFLRYGADIFENSGAITDVDANYIIALGDDGAVYVQDSKHIPSTLYDGVQVSMIAGPDAIGQEVSNSAAGTVADAFRIVHPSGGQFVQLLSANGGSSNTNYQGDTFFNSSIFALDNNGDVYSWGGVNNGNQQTQAPTTGANNVLFRSAPADLTASATPAPATYINNVIDIAGGLLPYTADGGKYATNFITFPIQDQRSIVVYFIGNDGDVYAINSTINSDGRYIRYSMPGSVNAVGIVTNEYDNNRVGGIQGSNTANDWLASHELFILGDDGNIYRTEVERTDTNGFVAPKSSFVVDFSPVPLFETEYPVDLYVAKGEEGNIVDMFVMGPQGYSGTNGRIVALTESGKLYSRRYASFNDAFFGIEPSLSGFASVGDLTNGGFIDHNALYASEGTRTHPPIKRIMGSIGVLPRGGISNTGLVLELENGVYIVDVYDLIEGTDANNNVSGITPNSTVGYFTGTSYYTSVLRDGDGNLVSTDALNESIEVDGVNQQYWTPITTCVSP